MPPLNVPFVTTYDRFAPSTLSHLTSYVSPRVALVFCESRLIRPSTARQCRGKNSFLNKAAPGSVVGFEFVALSVFSYWM